MLTEMAGYVIAPGAMHLNTFLWAGIGTGLCSSSANALNQVCTETAILRHCLSLYQAGYHLNLFIGFAFCFSGLRFPLTLK